MATMGVRPRLLLVPFLTELEWAIRPELEEWAEVATFDMPGVGAEPPVEQLTRQAIVDHALAEVDRRGWDSFIVACDGSALPTAVYVAHARREAVEAMAIGHARLVNRLHGDRPTLNSEVAAAFNRLANTDYSQFVRHGLTQMTQGSFGDELAERMLERIPIDIGREGYRMNFYDDEPFGHLIRELDAPLLFAKHEPCLISTDHGFEDALAAFPEARSVIVEQAPCVSPDFARALRELCEEVAALS